METCQLIANGRNDYQLSKQSENERVYIVALHCSLSPYCHLNLRHTHNIGTHWTIYVVCNSRKNIMIIISMKFLCDDLLRFESDDGFAIVSKRFNGLH